MPTEISEWQPKRPLVRKMADAVRAAREGMRRSPSDTVYWLGTNLPFEAVASTLDRAAYGQPLTMGRGQTTQLRPETLTTLEAATAVTPLGVPRKLALHGGQYTLRTLEGLPQRQANIPIKTIEQQLNRPEVTKAEKEIVRGALAGTDPAGTIGADKLVQRLEKSTQDFVLRAVDTNEYADYGLSKIGRSDPRLDSMDQEEAERAFMLGELVGYPNARTTIWELPTQPNVRNHFNDPSYFGHTRTFTEDGIPHVVEIQSDLAQHMRRLTPDERKSAVSELDDVSRKQEALWQKQKVEGWSYDTEHGTYLRPQQPETGAPNPYYTEHQKLKQRAQELEIKLNQDANVARAEPMVGPMLKNWDRRLIREELTRAATAPRVLNKDIIDAQKQLDILRNYTPEKVRDVFGDDPAARDRWRYAIDDAQGYLDQLKDARRQMPDAKPAKVVRFADADTVAKVEGWPRARDDLISGISNIKARITYLNGRVAAFEKEYGYPPQKHGDSGITQELERAQKLLAQQEERLAALGDNNPFINEDHQAIYQRYKGDIESHLRSLGGKRVVDKHGHGWWEVPVNQQRDVPTKLFSMGVLGTGTYGMLAPPEEDQ